jgi:hypothetical protein
MIDMRTMTKPVCKFCEGEPEPGWIETDNNGPIRCCPVCNPSGDDDRKWELAEAQRRHKRGT